MEGIDKHQSLLLPIIVRSQRRLPQSSNWSIDIRDYLLESKGHQHIKHSLIY